MCVQAVTNHAQHWFPFGTKVILTCMTCTINYMHIGYNVLLIRPTVLYVSVNFYGLISFPVMSYKKLKASTN